MIHERLLMDDGAVSIFDVRCNAAPAAAQADEVVEATQINFPLAGMFVRTVRRPGRVGAARTAIGDPGRVMIFRRDEPYRVSHPIAAHDRTLVIALRSPPAALERAAVEDRPVPSRATTSARRLAADLAAGRIDGLAAAEWAMALIASAGLEVEVRQRGGSDRDRRVAALVRVEVARQLGARQTLPELGRLVDLSGWELARRFRRATGTSIHAYRTQLRVQAALEQVEGGERDLTRLALDLGFADHSHMTNVVRRATGAPPSSYRQAARASTTTARVRTILQA